MKPCFLLFLQLNIGELRQQLEKSQAMFPENPGVWVKDLAGYLNVKLLAPDTDPTLSTYAHGRYLKKSFHMH